MNIPGSFFHPLRKFRSFRKFCNFRNSRNFGRGFPATLWINFVDFANGLANYRKFRSFRNFRDFRNSRNFGRGFPATLWINFVDFVNGLAKYRNFRSFRSCVQSWTLLWKRHVGAHQMCTNMASVNIWKLLWLSRRLIVCTEQTSIYIIPDYTSDRRSWSIR